MKAKTASAPPKPETRIEGQCSCGRKVTKILNSELPTMWLNGNRYVYTDEPEDGGCIYRCSCGKTIDRQWQKSSHE